MRVQFLSSRLTMEHCRLFWKSNCRLYASWLTLFSNCWLMWDAMHYIAAQALRNVFNQRAYHFFRFPSSAVQTCQCQLFIVRQRHVMGLPRQSRFIKSCVILLKLLREVLVHKNLFSFRVCHSKDVQITNRLNSSWPVGSKTFFAGCSLFCFPPNTVHPSIVNSAPASVSGSVPKIRLFSLVLMLWKSLTPSIICTGILSSVVSSSDRHTSRSL